MNRSVSITIMTVGAVLAGCASAPPPASVQTLSMDTALAAQVREQMATVGPVSGIDVRSDQGKVELRGSVADAGEARRAVKMALAVEGVRGVVNELEIAE